jgi:hypothetical protein
MAAESTLITEILASNANPAGSTLSVLFLGYSDFILSVSFLGFSRVLYLRVVSELSSCLCACNALTASYFVSVCVSVCVAP